MSERSRPRRVLVRTAVVVGTGCVLAAALGLVTGAVTLPGVVTGGGAAAVAVPAVEAVTSAPGRAATTAVTVLLLVGAAVLSWRPAREDVTALLLERWDGWEPVEPPESPTLADAVDRAEEPVELGGSLVAADAAPSAAALAPHPS